MTFKYWTPENKQGYIKAVKKACDYLSEYSPHLGFGSLLGAVREGKLIDGDNDIDICYLSKHNDIKRVQEEAVMLYRRLHKDGHLLKYWDVNYKVVPLANKITNVFGQAHITFDGYVIDLFTAWIAPDWHYHTAQWGKLTKSRFYRVAPHYFEGEPFNIPFPPEEIIETLYGNNWRIPSNDHPSKRLKRKCYIK
jgi:hypothetical protein